MLVELEKAVNTELEKDFPGVAKLKADFAPKPPKGVSVAEQLLAVAEAVRHVHKEIDALQDEVTRRLDGLRRDLGIKG